MDIVCKFCRAKRQQEESSGAQGTAYPEQGRGRQTVPKGNRSGAGFEGVFSR